jgi:F0F1-type ATP synthase assembly protein I
MDDQELIQESPSSTKKKKYLTLELCFSIFVAIIVLGAFIACLTYDFVSARTPIVILVPLLILSGFNIRLKEYF